MPGPVEQHVDAAHATAAADADAPSPMVRLTPSRLFHILFVPNLLSNASFLERHNSMPDTSDGAPDQTTVQRRRRVWVRAMHECMHSTAQHRLCNLADPPSAAMQ